MNINMHAHSLKDLFSAGSLSLMLAACSLSPSEECKAYVACQKEYAANYGGATLDLSIYEEEGDCWQDNEAADSCTATCIRSTQILIDATQNTPEGIPDACQ